MPGWQQTLSELEDDSGTRFDRFRSKHMSRIFAKTSVRKILANDQGATYVDEGRAER
jgi:hypothetical protein